MKTIYALNGSPRKGWTSEELLDSFIRGVRETDPEIDVKKVHLYDLDYKGCRSCYACKLKSTENGQCLFRDGATDLLRAIKTADGFAFATPIYYYDVPSQMRAILERLFYPAEMERELPVAALYSCADAKEAADELFRRHVDDISLFFRNRFHTEADVVFSANSIYYRDPEKYIFPSASYPDRVAYRDTHFPLDLQRAYEAGVRMAEKLR